MVQGSPTAGPMTSLEGFADFIRSTMADHKVPGMAVAVVKDGEVVFSQGFGLRDIQGAAVITPNTVFAIGSATKPFTTMGLAILADEGKLDWDAPVRTYLPSFQMHDPVATERMTPRDLVTHRSGLPRHDLVWYGTSPSRRELVDRLRYLEPNKDFRSVFQYQNLMYMTAGYLAGEIAGQSWEEFTQARILDPLGMSGSNFSVEQSQLQPDYALPHQEQGDTVASIPFRKIGSAGPAGSINSSVADMVQWVLLHLNKGKHGDVRIVSEAQLSQMHAPQMVMPTLMSGNYPELPNFAAYGLGWMLQPYRGHIVVHHAGGIDGFASNVALLPSVNAGVVVLSNIGSPYPAILVMLNACDRLLDQDPVPWNDRFKEMIAQEKEAEQKGRERGASERVAGTKPSHSLEGYTGDFAHPCYGTISIRLDGNQLRGTRDDLSFSVNHNHYDIFEAVLTVGDSERRLTLAFSTSVKGEIDGFSAPLEPAVADIVFKRVPAQEMRDKRFLEQFVGVYEVAGVSMVIALKGESTLQVSLPGQPDYELVPYRDTEFTFKGLSGFSVTFKTDTAGAVTEAMITQPNGVFTATRKAEPTPPG